MRTLPRRTRVSENGWVCIHGEGGSGKTVLASRTLRQQHHLFGDHADMFVGCVYHTLTGSDDGIP